MEREKPREPPQAGDIRLDPFEVLRSEQPLSGEEKALLRRGYDLFEFYRRHLLEEHGEMRRARARRQKKQQDRSRTSPASNTLGSCIDNAVADQIDNRPEALMIPEREETAQSAEEMTDVVSFVLYQAKFDETYATLMEDAAVTGTGVAQVFWDDDLDGGEGMASVMAWHPEDFYPDPMYGRTIQLGRGCFKATRTSVAWVEQHYPHARGFVQPDQATRPEEEDDPMLEAPEGDAGDHAAGILVQEYNAQTRRTHVHMALFAGRALLYSSETGYGNEEGAYDEGVYAHGQYPFVLYKYRDVLAQALRHGHGLRLSGQPGGHRPLLQIPGRQRAGEQRSASLYPQGKRCQPGRRGRPAQDHHRVGRKRHPRGAPDGAGRAAERSGLSDDDAADGRDEGRQRAEPGLYARGEGGKGVTAASAIQALQEAGGKIARMHTEKYAKAAFRQMVEQILWVLSEYIEASGRKMKIIGGWDSSGNIERENHRADRPEGRGATRLPKPAYTVRVQVQKDAIRSRNSGGQRIFDTGRNKIFCAQSRKPGFHQKPWSA